MQRAIGAVTLTQPLVVGLYFIQRYRFLTIAQVSRVAGLTPGWTADVLYALERRGLLGHFGHVRIPGHGKTPKAYYLKRKGWEILRRESDIPDELLGPFTEIHQETTWSPQMYHRLRLIDLLIALELQVRNRPHLHLVKTFVEYRRIKRNGRIARETTDFVAAEETPENRIIPDAAFVLENQETGRRGLFFVEMDMATERIVTQITKDRRVTLRFKFEQYDRYLTNGRFVQTYSPYGKFGSFTLLFVTFGEERIEHIRRSLADLSANLHHYYRFATFEEAQADFLGPVWRSRSPEDQERYRLTRQ